MLTTYELHTWRILLFFLVVALLGVGVFLVWWYWYDILTQVDKSVLWWKVNIHSVLKGGETLLYTVMCLGVLALAGGFIWTHILFPYKRGVSIHGVHYEDTWSDD